MALGLIALFWPLISKVIQLILGADKGGLKPAE
jgi:hypothetical protein